MIDSNNPQHWLQGITTAYGWAIDPTTTLKPFVYTLDSGSSYDDLNNNFLNGQNNTFFGQVSFCIEGPDGPELIWRGYSGINGLETFILRINPHALDTKGFNQTIPGYFDKFYCDGTHEIKNSVTLFGWLAKMIQLAP